jgi:glycosyltransferase involved in cell wall biosynthesis
MSSKSHTLSTSEIVKIYEERYNPDEEYLGRDKEVNKIDPLVSVFITTYQHAPFIRDCLEGALMQKTTFPVEILIGEDESTDGTREICIEYAEKYPDKIRLFLRDRKTSQLYDDAGNRVCRFNGKWLRKEVRGKYLAACEGDDYWNDPLKLEKQITLMEKNPDCHISFHPVFVDWGGNSKSLKVHKKHYDHNHIFSTEELIIGGGEFCPTASVVFNMKSYSFEPWRIDLPVQDYFSQVLLSMNGGALYINKVMAVYRKGVPGSWSDKHKSYLKICEHSLKMINANRIFDEQTEYKYHKAFKKRERILFKKYGVFLTFFHDYEALKKIISFIKKYMSGVLKYKCYLYLILSFFYFKLKIKYIFKIKNKIITSN